MPPSQICRQTCHKPICQPQGTTGWWRVWRWRLWLGRTARVKTNHCFLPVRIARDFIRRKWGDTSGTWHYGFWQVGPMEVREVQDTRLVGGTVRSTGEWRHQKISQGGEGVFHTSTANAGIGLLGGHSPGSPCATMSPQKEVYAPSQFNLCMQGHSRSAQGKSSGIHQSPPALGRANQPAC